MHHYTSSSAWSNTRLKLRLLVATAVAILTSCGGGDDDTCRATAGTFPMSYEPGISNGAGYSRLFYQAGTDQEWKLVFHGTTAACSRGLQVSAPSNLPAGYSIDAGTGTIRRSASSGPSGFCIAPNVVTEWWNDGVCPPGTTAQINGYLIKIESDGFHRDTPPFVTLGVSFEPGS